MSFLLPGDMHHLLNLDPASSRRTRVTTKTARKPYSARPRRPPSRPMSRSGTPRRQGKAISDMLKIDPGIDHWRRENGRLHAEIDRLTEVRNENNRLQLEISVLRRSTRKMMPYSQFKALQDTNEKYLQKAATFAEENYTMGNQKTALIKTLEKSRDKFMQLHEQKKALKKKLRQLSQEKTELEKTHAEVQLKNEWLLALTDQLGDEKTQLQNQHKRAAEEAVEYQKLNQELGALVKSMSTQSSSIKTDLTRTETHMSKLKTTQMTMQATQDAQTGMIANLKDKNNKYMNSIKEITRTNTYLKKERENQARELAAAELQVKKLAAQQLDLQNKISAQGVTSMKKEKAAAVLQKQKEYELHQLTVTHEKLATDNDRLTVESIELKRALKEAVTELETVRVTAAVPKRRRRPPA